MPRTSYAPPARFLALSVQRVVNRLVFDLGSRTVSIVGLCIHRLGGSFISPRRSGPFPCQGGPSSDMADESNRRGLMKNGGKAIKDRTLNV